MDTKQILDGLNEAIKALNAVTKGIQIIADHLADETPVNRPPLSINPYPLPDAQVGKPYSADLPTTSDPDGDSVQYEAATGIPDGLSEKDGKAVGTPTKAGDFQIARVSKDPAGLKTILNVTLTVKAAEVTTGTALELDDPLCDLAGNSFTFRSKGGDGTAIEYMAAGIMGWSTNPTHGIDNGLRLDVLNGAKKSVTMMARQSGKVVKRDFQLATNVPTSGGNPGNGNTGGNPTGPVIGGDEPTTDPVKPDVVVIPNVDGDADYMPTSFQGKLGYHWESSNPDMLDIEITSFDKKTGDYKIRNKAPNPRQEPVPGRDPYYELDDAWMDRFGVRLEDMVFRGGYTYILRSFVPLGDNRDQSNAKNNPTQNASVSFYLI